MYDRLGRMAIGFALAYLRRRYKRQIRIGAGLAVLGAGLGIAYVATRRPPEG